MPKTTKKTAIENRAVAGLRGLRSDTLSALNTFGTAAASAGGTFQGAPAAAELAERVTAQVARLFDELETAAATVGGDVLREFETIMRILDLEKLLESVGKLIDSITDGAAKLWIKLLQEIKKIIRVLWELFFGKLPRWLETILLLIDELAKHAVELLFPKLATELNAGEVAYLREVHAARRISLLEDRGGAHEED